MPKIRCPSCREDIDEMTMVRGDRLTSKIHYTVPNGSWDVIAFKNREMVWGSREKKVCYLCGLTW